MPYISGISREKYNKSGFTLAEVLITLSIIGIVAALTIPGLAAKHYEKERVSQLKKIYSELQQAYTHAVNDFGTPDTWNLIEKDSREGAQNIVNILIKYLKPLKTCDINENGCFAQVTYFINNSPSHLDYTKYGKFIISDNTAFAVIILSDDCNLNRGSLNANRNICGVIDVDTNGLKKPNVYGKDIFSFNLTKYGIFPKGLADSQVEGFSLCKTSGGQCTAWVIYNENMDYLHCDDLSWDGKHSCKVKK